jgi:hypothetical protein
MLQFEAIPPSQEDHTRTLGLTRLMPISDLGMVFLLLLRSVVNWK